MKKIFFLFITLFLMILKPITVFSLDREEIYNEQLKISNAEEIKNNLPQKTQEDFNDIGINKVDWNQILKITPEKIFSKSLNIAKNQIPQVFKSVLMILSVIFLSALASVKTSIGQKSLKSVLETITSLFVCIVIINPVVHIISKSTVMLGSVSKYLLCYIPIMTGIMIANGQSISAVSFSTLMITASEVISQISNFLLLPFLSSFLTVSIVSSVSSKFNLSVICNFFSKFIKWLIGFSMTVFSGILALQNIVATTADSAKTKATKFLINGCVPVVGSALSDAFLTVSGCVKLLKSGVGAFFILAVFFIFLPVIIECLLWILSVNLCSSIGEIFELQNISKLLKRIGEVMSMLLIIDLCVAILLIVSTAVILVVSGNG